MNGRPCYYCGELVSGRNLHVEHVVPVSKGGSSKLGNLVDACNICNGIKGTRTIEASRRALIQKRIGWPKFTEHQLSWLRANGFDMSPFDNGKLAFEE